MDARPRLRPFRTETLPASGVTEVIQEFLARTSGPLDFELGSGAGVHSIRYAAEHPERRLISVEKTSEKFARFAGRLANHAALPNLLPLQANAISVMAHDLTAASLDRIFLWYPNPFPEKSRFVRLPFFARLVECLGPGGELHFATNVAEHADDYRELTVAGGLELVGERRITQAADPDFRPRTLFEKKYYLRDETLYEFVFRRG